MIKIIVAMNQHRTIGLNGSMPWHNKEDLKHFRATTLNQKVVMGRKTFEGLPTKLDQREIYVVTRSKSFENAIPNLMAFLKENEHSNEDIFIAGGGEIYAQSLPFAHELIISYIPNDVVGDTFFPDFSDLEFKIKNQVEYSTFKQVTYERI